MESKGDVNEKGQCVEWSVELWAWSDYLKHDTKVERKTFNLKILTKEYIQKMLETTLCVSINVYRLTYDNINWAILPSRKLMYTFDI